MNFYDEAVYEEPNSGTLPRVVFDPMALPIRSCLRPEDELVSNYGPVQQKSVGFCDYLTVITFESCDELYVDMSGYQNLSGAGHKMYPSMPRKVPTYQNYPLEVNASESPICTSTKSSLKHRVGSPLVKKSVHFALMQENLTPVGEITKTFVAFDPLPDCWKANFAFDCGAYWLNCNLCR